MPPINAAPVQRWLTRWSFANGATTDLITEFDKGQIDNEIIQAKLQNRDAEIEGVNDKGWPVYMTFDPKAITLRIIVPHEVYLAARPSISLH